MENIMAPYGFAGDFFAIVLCLLCISVLRSSYTIKHTNLRLFYTGVGIVFFSSIQSILFHSMIDEPLLNPVNSFLFISFQNSVLIGLQILLIVMLEYLMNLFLMPKKEKTKFRVVVWTVALSYAAYKFYAPLHDLDMHINKTTGMVENYSMQDNSFIYVYLMIYACIAVVVITHRKALIEHVYYCLVTNAVLPFLIIVGSYLFNITTFICISYMIPILAVLFLFHYNAYDTKTGTLDLRAFKSYINDLDKHNHFLVFSLRLKKDVLDKNETLARGFVLYIQDTFKERSKYCLFRLSNNHFMLVYTYNEDNAKNTLELIEMKVKYGLQWLYTKWGIPYQALQINSDPALTSEDYIGLSHYLLSKANLNSYTVCSEEDINDFKKYIAINAALNEMQQNNAINDERIVVYYQPIINQDGKCVKAEALLRLNIDGTMYYPGDFLPVVENENYSHFITKAVLNKVCGHIKLLESQGYEFEKISINLSTEDLLINDGYKDLIDIVENKHKMTFQKIAFEILENTDKVQYEPLVRAMTAFKSITDVEFYLDDFGSGYSNLLRLLSLPVSIIKFDKDILKKIRKNSNIFSTVKTNVETFLEAGYNILFEGVEDEVDIASCKQMNVNFLQGYAYSKPVELEAVKTFFNKAE